MDVFVRGVGIVLTHRKLYDKKIKIGKSDRGTEPEGENAKKPPFDEFLNRIVIYRITTQTTSSSSKILISYSRNVRAL